MPLLPSTNSSFRPTAIAAAVVTAIALLAAGCGKSDAPTADKVASAKGAADKHDDHGKDGHADDKAAGHGKDEKDKDEHAGEGAIKLSEEEQKTAGIRVEAVKEQPVSDQVLVTATIQANKDRQAKIAPRVPGRVVNVGANLGDRVRAGQVLATLDSLEVGETRSLHAQAESETRLTAANLERAERLQSEQIVSQKDLLRARAEHEKARAALRAAADKLKMLGLAALKDGADLSVFPVTAPFAGTVIEKKAVLGDLAQPDSALFMVADLSTLWIEANLLEKDLSRIRTGGEATVTVEAYPNERFKGRLIYIGSSLDRETRTLRGRILVSNADGRLKPEMFATAAIQAGGTAKAIVLPDEAITLVAGVPTVFVEEHGGFEPRQVELGSRMQGRAVVKAGLKADERVVIAGTYALKARLLKSQIGEGHAH